MLVAPAAEASRDERVIELLPVVRMLRVLDGYHGERAGYGGAAQEFHARAQTACSSAAEIISATPIPVTSVDVEALWELATRIRQWSISGVDTVGWARAIEAAIGGRRG
jgi:hypothetical protein